MSDSKRYHLNRPFLSNNKKDIFVFLSGVEFFLLFLSLCVLFRNRKPQFKIINSKKKRDNSLIFYKKKVRMVHRHDILKWKDIEHENIVISSLTSLPCWSRRMVDFSEILDYSSHKSKIHFFLKKIDTKRSYYFNVFIKSAKCQNILTSVNKKMTH